MTRNDRYESRRNPIQRDTDKWRRQLRNSLPLVGGWLRLEAARLLKQAADQGNPQATLILALAYAESPDAKVHEISLELLESIEDTARIDAVWMAWMESRHPAILQFLLAKNWIATAPPRARVYSALRLERLDLLIQGSPDIAAPLVEAFLNEKPELAAQARECLVNLQNQETIDAVCDRWVRDRNPILEGIVVEAGYIANLPANTRCLTALANSQESIIRDCEAGMVPSLIKACHDQNKTIAARARSNLVHLSNPEAVDAVCLAWADKRPRWLGDALLQAGYVASQPPAVRTLTALKTGRGPVLRDLEPECIPFLVDACQDEDPSIRKNALPALQNLARIESQETLCLFACENEHPLARRVAIEQGFEPRSPENRALFYFLTDQWDRFEALDFDRSLLRIVYETSSADLRRRIIRKLQQAGRTDYLTVLAGNDFRSRASQMTDAEIDALVKILISQKEWAKLWSLVFELAATWSVRIARALPQEDWLPEAADDRTVFEVVTRLAQQIPESIWTEWELLLPLAIPKARVRVSGRINDVTFSPTEPVIAVATGNRKVALWDYQKAEIRRTIAGFAHSIGRISFLPDGSLVCGERTISQEPCGVYLLDGEMPVCLGHHLGTVTALEPAGKRLALSAGRDQFVRIWDLSIRTKIIETHMSQWPRQARVSPEMDAVVVLGKTISVLGLPNLDENLWSLPWRESGNGISEVSRCAAFTTRGGSILVGKPHGSIVGYAQKGQRLAPEKQPIISHRGPIQGIEYLSGRDLVISASSDGEVRFTRWSSRKPLGSVSSPGERLTSLCISGDGSFMATGDTDSSLSLWDLRLLDVPSLVSIPFSRFTLAQINTIFALSTDMSGLQPAVEATLKFMQAVVGHRSRYDIQIDAVPAIRAGEYDIFIE